MLRILEELKTNLDQGQLDEAYKMLDLLDVEDDKLKEEVLLLLDDHVDADDLMYAFIHIAETLDDKTYVRNLFKCIEAIFEKAPNWCGFLLVRIVNNPETFSVLKALLKQHPDMIPVLNKVREVALEMKTDIPQLG
ncbi:MAG TPA: Imm30 family immunity protein [Chryseolinea sp.]